MLSWMITHYKATIAIMTGILTSIVVPTWFFAIGMIVKIDTTVASITEHNLRIIKLEEAVYRSEESNKRIEGYLQRIEEREYQELKAARQSRQAQNNKEVR